MPKQKKGRIERFRKFSGKARDRLLEKMDTLETQVQEERTTILIGVGVLLLGIAIGAILAPKKEKE